MTVSKHHYVHLRDGRFDGTTAADMEAAFDQFRSTRPAQGLTLHFHGGLVSESAGMKIAERLLPQYESAGVYPYFFVWEAGFLEAVRNNLPDIVRDRFFKKLLARLAGFLGPRLIGLSSSETLAAENIRVAAFEHQIEKWFEYNPSHVPLEHLPPAESTMETDVSTEQLAAVFENDIDLETAFQEFAARVASSPPIEEALEKQSPSQLHINETTRAELFGRDDVTADEFSAISWAVRVARVAARVGTRVLKRFVGRRDHGLVTTLIEELLRELYIDDIGKAFIWNQMKKDTADAFGPDPLLFGGTAVLHQLRKLINETPETSPRVTLIGHSAGAIYIANLLMHAHGTLPENFKFDVVFLAPAVDAQLLSRVIKTGRIANFRQFGMLDVLESSDALLSGFSPLLTPVYPRSLLYFVSGLLEATVDEPIIGMQRYMDSAVYPDADFPELAEVREFLTRRPDQLVFSPNDQGDGLRTNSRHHGDFDNDDATVYSLLHLLANGFSVEDEFNLTRESLMNSLSHLPPKDLSAVYRSLPFNGKGISKSVESTLASAGNCTATDLLDAVANRHYGLAELLVHTHRIRPQAKLLQKHISGIAKADVSIQQEFTARGIALDLSSDPTLESTGSDAPQSPAVPVLIRLGSTKTDLAAIKGLKVVSKIGSIIAAQVSPEAIPLLELDENVLSLELSSEGTGYDCERSLPFIGLLNDDPADDIAEKGDECIVGVIDGGIDILHGAFREPDSVDDNGKQVRGRTRLLAVWDQRTNTGPAPDGFPMGTLHTAEDINRYIDNQRVERGLGRDASGHGTHVASIAVGTPLPDHGFPQGVAPKARLVVVITGRNAYEIGSPNSLGYSVSHAAALQFIDQIATGDLPDDQIHSIHGMEVGNFRAKYGEQGLPVVVNVSQGMNSGAHDGTSLVETMFDDFCENGRKSGRVVVKSAGNDRQKAGHASVKISGNSMEKLTWESLPPDPAVSYTQRGRDVIELWFDALHPLTFRLVSPGGEASAAVDAATMNVSDSFSTGNQYSINYSRLFRDNGCSRVRIEIKRGSAAVIEAGPTGPPARRGAWTLEIISGVLFPTIEIDAWIDRTDFTPARFIGSHVDQNRTLSVPGTAQSVITVGAIEAKRPIAVGDFSGYGPTRDQRKQPQICAPGVAIRAARGGAGEFDLRPDNGTSMASPHVAGAVALVLSQGWKHKDALNSVPNARQITGAFGPNHANWHPGRGFRVLDVKDLLEQFATANAAEAESPIT